MQIASLSIESYYERRYRGVAADGQRMMSARVLTPAPLVPACPERVVI
jgi:hypothetical protein